MRAVEKRSVQKREVKIEEVKNRVTLGQQTSEIQLTLNIAYAV